MPWLPIVSLAIAWEVFARSGAVTPFMLPAFSTVVERIWADGVSGDGEKPLHAELSQREFQIFCKLASGAAVSKIADELNLSVKTVSTYRTRILEKMAMKSNADLTYYAIKNGLIE